MAISRPVTRTIISTTGWGIPITDQVNEHESEITVLQSSAWVAVPFQGGWSPGPMFGFPAVSIRKVGALFMMRGLAQASVSYTANTLAATLPVGYRPLVPILAMAPIQIGAPTNMYRVNLGNDGTISFSDGLAATSLVGFDSIYFPSS